MIKNRDHAIVPDSNKMASGKPGAVQAGVTGRIGYYFKNARTLADDNGLRLQIARVRAEAAELLLSRVVARTTQIGVVEESGGRAVLGGRVVGLAGEKRGDALAVEDAQVERAGETASRRAGSRPRYERRMPRQVRNPCSGCGGARPPPGTMQ
jgi:hypothetical protein